MQLALAQAVEAAQAGEVPVGAVIMKNGVLIASGRNAPIQNHDPTAHAEIQALRSAAQVLGNYRLDGCELFVTLEPCAMCAGAMLHARLQRVVYGASDPKTGAAGSVLNLFSSAELNHHTQVHSGLLASPCATVLQDFFKQKRKSLRRTSSPVRDDALRTPDARFSALPDYPWPPNYLCTLPSLAGLRLHYLDLGHREAAVTCLCLHGTRHWSYIFRGMIPEFLATGYRVLVPDLIGFGKSDKPKKEHVHTLDWHGQVLAEWLDHLDLHGVTLIAPEGDDRLAQALLQARPSRCVRIQCISPAQLGRIDLASENAPFPDRGHRAALRAFASPSS